MLNKNSFLHFSANYPYQVDNKIEMTDWKFIYCLHDILICMTIEGFARHGMQSLLYAHNFALPPGFLFFWRGIEKNNKKSLNIWFTSQTI